LDYSYSENLAASGAGYTQPPRAESANVIEVGTDQAQGNLAEAFLKRKMREKQRE